MSKTIVDALSVFYTLLGVSLFVPVVAGLFMRRARALRRPRRDRRRRIGGRGSATLERRRADRGVHAGDVRACGGSRAFAAVATLVPGGRPPSVGAARRRS